MNYIIVAKNIKDDIENTNPLKRTEICTELIMPRLKLIELYNTKKINKTDTIVTRIDRKCLYENLFENIIDFNDFEKIKYTINKEDIIDLVSQIYELDKTIPYKPTYQRFDLDKNEIFNIKLRPNKEITPFICILIRKTPNHPEKNLPDEYWNDLIEEITIKNENLNIFIFGEKTENIKNAKAKHVSDFKSWCTLLNDDNCKCVISTVSGGVYPIFFVGHENAKMIIIDNNNLLKTHGDSPSFYNPCINFKNVKIYSFDYIPKMNELSDKIFEYGGI